MPPPLSGNKVTRVSALKIPDIFAQKSTTTQSFVKKVVSNKSMGNKQTSEVNNNNQQKDKIATTSTGDAGIKSKEYEKNGVQVNGTATINNGTNGNVNHLQNGNKIDKVLPNSNNTAIKNNFTSDKQNDKTQDQNKIKNKLNVKEVEVAKENGAIKIDNKQAITSTIQEENNSNKSSANLSKTQTISAKENEQKNESAVIKEYNKTKQQTIASVQEEKKTDVAVITDTNKTKTKNISQNAIIKNSNKASTTISLQKEKENEIVKDSNASMIVNGENGNEKDQTSLFSEDSNKIKKQTIGAIQEEKENCITVRKDVVKEQTAIVQNNTEAAVTQDINKRNEIVATTKREEKKTETVVTKDVNKTKEIPAIAKQIEKKSEIMVTKDIIKTKEEATTAKQEEKKGEIVVTKNITKMNEQAATVEQEMKENKNIIMNGSNEKEEQKATAKQEKTELSFINNSNKIKEKSIANKKENNNETTIRTDNNRTNKVTITIPEEKTENIKVEEKSKITVTKDSNKTITQTVTKQEEKKNETLVTKVTTKDREKTSEQQITTVIQEEENNKTKQQATQIKNELKQNKTNLMENSHQIEEQTAKQEEKKAETNNVTKVTDDSNKVVVQTTAVTQTEKKSETTVMKDTSKIKEQTTNVLKEEKKKAITIINGSKETTTTTQMQANNLIGFSNKTKQTNIETECTNGFHLETTTNQIENKNTTVMKTSSHEVAQKLNELQQHNFDVNMKESSNQKLEKMKHSVVNKPVSNQQIEEKITSSPKIANGIEISHEMKIKNENQTTINLKSEKDTIIQEEQISRELNNKKEDKGTIPSSTNEINTNVQIKRITEHGGYKIQDIPNRVENKKPPKEINSEPTLSQEAKIKSESKVQIINRTSTSKCDEKVIAEQNAKQDSSSTGKMVRKENVKENISTAERKNSIPEKTSITDGKIERRGSIKKQQIERRNSVKDKTVERETITVAKIETKTTQRQNSVDSNYGTLSTLQSSPSFSSISSNETAATTTSSVYDTAKTHLTAQLPPVAPVKKQQPYKKAHTSPLNTLPESTQKLAAHLQTRPLQNSKCKTPNNEDIEKITTGRLILSRSPSPALSVSRSLSPSCSRTTRSRSLTTYSRNSSSSTTTPRRIFPQEAVCVDLNDLDKKDASAVVYDANLSFIMGCKSQMRQSLKSTAAHMDSVTASNYLSSKICEFLHRTDHVMDEWKNLGHRGDDENTFPKSEEERRITGRSKSAANIAIKGYTLFSKDRSISGGRSLGRSRSNSTVRDFMTDDVFSECDELSEMTADLAEEHSTATLAAERLDAETSERIRLERELSEVQNKNKSLQQNSERLEMELLYARSDMNGVISEEDEDGEGGGDNGIYKAKYDRAVRELEFTRRRLQQQHEDDLEQLVGLKKQLEKKLSDAYEEVEEQRQVVGQWKRKVQKLTSEMNDLRLLIEEQNARNNLLEKKQRKFDSESQLLNDELRQERQQRERLSREKDLIIAEKYTLESNLADVRLELELKEERLTALQQEYNDLTFGGKSEDEVATLRKQKQDAERRLHEQEEELDDLAGQVQMLEQAKVRLEMSLEQHRKEARREAQQRDDELEEVRCNAQKKVKALEAQLENEHEERTLLLREKHSLERRLAALTEAGRTEREGDEAQLQRLKRDLRRTKALLRDAQTMLERQKADSPGKAVIRQLRNQLDDLECARAAAVKAKQSIESELADVQSQLDDAHRQRSEAEDRANAANRERSDLRTQLEENEEELAEVLKKYRSTVQQLSSEQMALQEQLSLVAEIEAERNSLKEQLAELTTKLESMETMADPSSSAQVKRMELRVKELESKLEFEQTTRARLEVQISRLKEQADKLQTELALSRTKEQQALDNVRKLQRTLRELREEHSVLTTRETESLQKRKELEKKLEGAESETVAARADLRLALQRIDDLQAAIQGELEDTNSDRTDSENDSYSSDESIDTFLANHKISPNKVTSVSAERSALHLDTSPRRGDDSSKLIASSSNDSFA